LLKEEMIAMMGRTFETQRLPIGFTFRIIEAVKRIKIDPVSIGKGVPWGLSLATGLLIAILGLNPQFMKMVQIDLTNLAVSGESSVLETGDFPVDIAKISEEPFLAKPEGANNGKSISDNPLIQNAFLLAPQGEGGTWTKKADMLTARGNISPTASIVNGKIYIIGGADGAKALSEVEEYDPKKDKWTRKADMPSRRSSLSTSAVNGKVYAIGGHNDINGNVLATVEEYDPVNDIWTKKADMPSPRQWLSTSVVNGKIYAIGGYDDPGMVSVSTVEEYDPVMDKWINKSDMPTNRGYFSTAVVDNKIYAIGGLKDQVTPASSIEEYDPIKDKWVRKKSIAEVAGAGCGVANGKIYIISGVDRPNHWSEIVQEYDPINDILKKMQDISVKRISFSTADLNGKILAIGGFIDQKTPTAAVEEYTPEDWSVSPQGKLPTKWGEIKK
ncbi:MAG: kelch repeat-containing protein, partial [Candidatus Poribacteria bacterium]